MFNNLKTNKQGMTLIEVLVALSIFSLISVMLVNFILSGFRDTRFQEEQSHAVAVARKAMEAMKVEVRGLINSEQGSYPIELIDNDEFIFYNDIDNNGKSEKIRYHLVGSILYKEITEPGASLDYSGIPTNKVIAEYINNDDEDIFTFYNSNNVVTDVINNVRLVRIVLKINVTPEIAPNDIFLETDIMFRNLKDNL